MLELDFHGSDIARLVDQYLFNCLHKMARKEDNKGEKVKDREN
jgi:hypothetical protein